MAFKKDEMKIGFVITYFYPFSGGAETNCLELAKQLVKKGHEVHVFTSDRKGNEILEKEETYKGIKIHRSKTWFRYKYYFACYPSLISNLLKYKLDIVHVHSTGFLQHDFSVLFKKLFSPRTKFICTPHGPFMALQKYSFFASSYKSFVSFLEKNIFNKLYNAVIEVNPFQEKWLRQSGFKKIVLVPNGIPESSFKKHSASSFIKKYRLKNKFVLGYLGRIQEYKGLEQVIQILPELKNAVFLAVGEDAGFKKNLDALATSLNVKDRVIFTGHISDPEKAQALNLMHVFVLPSEWEAFGISMLEAMALAKPAVSTNTEGARYLLKKEFIFEKGGLSSFLKIIKKLHNPALRRKAGLENLKKARSFLWSSISDKLVSIYNNL